MTVLYEKTVALSALHDEILASHPELRETLRVEGTDEWCRLTFPDDTAKAVLDSVAAIVDAHDPAAVETKRAWNALRAERNARLAATDYTQLPDAPAELQTDWQAYRQQLRDLPENTVDPANPVWPDTPVITPEGNP